MGTSWIDSVLSNLWPVLNDEIINAIVWQAFDENGIPGFAVVNSALVSICLPSLSSATDPGR